MTDYAAALEYVAKTLIVDIENLIAAAEDECDDCGPAIDWDGGEEWVCCPRHGGAAPDVAHVGVPREVVPCIPVSCVEPGEHHHVIDERGQRWIRHDAAPKDESA